MKTVDIGRGAGVFALALIKAGTDRIESLTSRIVDGVQFIHVILDGVDYLGKENEFNMEGWDLYRLMKFGFGFPATATDRFQHLHYDLENKLGYRVEEISIRKDDPMLCVHRVAFSEDGGEEVPRTLLTD